MLQMTLQIFALRGEVALMPQALMEMALFSRPMDYRDEDSLNEKKKIKKVGNGSTEKGSRYR